MRDAEASVAALPNPPLKHLLLPKLLTARANSRRGEKGGTSRWLLVGLLGLAFWGAIFLVLARLLQYFKSVPEIGPLLAGKLLGLVLIGFFSILLLSNVITALSSFFLAKDLDMLVGAPVDWLRFYGAKLAETAVNSSWMVVLMAVPIVSAYGVVYDGGWGFPIVALAVFIPFLLIPAVIGSAITLTLVNVFPARRTRDILSVIAVLAGAGIVVLFRLVRPERLASPDGFRSLVEFVSVLRTPTSPLLPSEWVQRSIMGWLTYTVDALPFYLLWSTAAAAVVLGALLHRASYAKGYTRAQESARNAAPSPRLRQLAMRALSVFGTRRRELLLKEIRLFFRDSTQWSQLILLSVLVVVYVFNIRFLPLRGEGITPVLRVVVPFLNIALSGFVLSSVAARFIFPGVSLEGRTLWLLRSSPLAMRDLLWAKFWVGTAPLLVVALVIVGLTNYMLQVSEFMAWVSLLTIVFMTFGVAGLAVGFGTLYPRFETENAAQIPTSFGGLLYMMTAITMIGVVIVLEARPVLRYMRSVAFGEATEPQEMVLGLGLAAVVCLIATLVPIRIALRRLETIGR